MRWSSTREARTDQKHNCGKLGVCQVTGRPAPLIMFYASSDQVRRKKVDQVIEKGTRGEVSWVSVKG